MGHLTPRTKEEGLDPIKLSLAFPGNGCLLWLSSTLWGGGSPPAFRAMKASRAWVTPR